MNTIHSPGRSVHWRRFIFNPITIKELRSTFRQRRFLIVYWTSLVAYSLIVLALAMIEVTNRGGVAGGPVGQRLFNYCVAAQLALMLFVLPGFAAAAVTDERENQSFDLLVTTALRAFDIVWGKLLACMSYAFLFLAATFPLVCLSVLYTGVRPGEILFAYVLMSMVAVLMVSAGLASSSMGTSSRRSVAVTYVLSLLASTGCGVIVHGLTKRMPDSYSRANVVGYYYDMVFHSGISSAVWSAVIPLVAWGLASTVLLIVAVDRLKPTTANKSTGLRIVGLIAAGTALAGVTTHFLTTADLLGARVASGLTVLVLEAVLLSVFVVGACCEEPRVSRRVQWEYQWAAGWRRPLRLVLPGSASGLLYTLVVTALLLGGTAWIVLKSVDMVRPAGASPGHLQSFRSAITWTAVLLGSMIGCFAAMGRFCSTIFAGGIYSRTVIIFVFVMANLVPICVMTLNDQAILGRVTSRPGNPSTLWNLHYASAFLALRSVWDMTGYWPLPDRGIFGSRLFVGTWQIDQPLAMVSVTFYAAVGAIMAVWGAWRQRFLVRRDLKVLYPTSPTGGSLGDRLASPDLTHARS